MKKNGDLFLSPDTLVPTQLSKNSLDYSVPVLLVSSCYIPLEAAKNALSTFLTLLFHIINFCVVIWLRERKAGSAIKLTPFRDVFSKVRTYTIFDFWGDQAPNTHKDFFP